MDEAAFYRLITGETRGTLPGLKRAALRVASWFYRAAIVIRNSAFSSGWKMTHRAPLPVISLGNLTAGGTGKTPLAAYIARWFRQRDVRVCFLSRGYGAADGGLNDEALVLEQLCPDVPHLQHPDRVASARIAHEELESQLLILDDGFQHRQLARDLDIVLIDASNPWGHGFLLPRGLLREPVSGLSRAELVVITRVDQATSEQLASIRGRISSLAPRCDIVEVAFPLTKLIRADGASASFDAFRGKPIAAFCGIGNPQAFRTALERSGLVVAAFRSFPDHHIYSRADIEGLAQWSASFDVAAVVVTQKDIVKICQERLGNHPLWAAQIDAEVVRGQSELDRHLEQVLANVQPAAS